MRLNTSAAAAQAMPPALCSAVAWCGQSQSQSQKESALRRHLLCRLVRMREKLRAEAPKRCNGLDAARAESSFKCARTLEQLRLDRARGLRESLIVP